MLINRIPFPAGGGFDPIKDISYTGAYTAEEKTIDGIAYWLLTFTGSGTLTVNKDGLIGDVCVCGGGSGGASGQGSPYNVGGRGGNGGFVNNYTNQEIISGDITIGAGGNANAAGGGSSYNSLNANGGLAPSNWGSTTLCGGSGGGSGNTSNSYKGQGTTTRPFGSTEFDPLGAGGGGGSTRSWSDDVFMNGGTGGTDGGAGGLAAVTSGAGNGGAGGNKGGGSGGSDGAAGSAATYYGGGGGGGAHRMGSTSSGGKGYQGVVMIRIPK